MEGALSTMDMCPCGDEAKAVEGFKLVESRAVNDPKQNFPHIHRLSNIRGNNPE
jgi:hypothetical protein